MYSRGQFLVIIVAIVNMYGMHEAWMLISDHYSTNIESNFDVLSHFTVNDTHSAKSRLIFGLDPPNEYFNL